MSAKLKVNFMPMNIEKLKYPIGKWAFPKNSGHQEIEEWTQMIEQLPKKIEDITKGLREEQLNWIYRPNGWSIKQVVHHLADSHMNSFIRYKLTLTEDLPTIKPYHEAKWAEMDDHSKVKIAASKRILQGVHERWSVLLRSMGTKEFQRKYIHPESKREFTLIECTSLYSWHCEHHLAHLLQALKNEGQYSLVTNL